MRQSAPTILLLAAAALAAACGTSSNDPVDVTEPARHRPERPNLLRDFAEIAGQAVIVSESDGWQHRRAPGIGGNKSALAVRHTGGPGSAGPPPGAIAADSGAGMPAPGEGVSSGPGGTTTFAPATGGPTAGGPAGSWSTPATESRVLDSKDDPGARPAPRLAAGSTDDNRQFEDFLQYLAEARENPGLKDRFVDLDVAGRSSIRVVDRDGACVPGRRITVVDETGDRVIWRGTTQGDGSVPFYPGVVDAAADGRELLIIEVENATGDRVVRHAWNGAADTTVRLPDERPALEPLQLDVAFVIDTTGSMRDEIAAIKTTLLATTARLRALGREFDLRYGAVLYRDLGDEYVTAQHPFTGDIEAFDEVLESVTANGGGDGPESLNQGLAVAVDGLQWRAGAAKVAFLIADAPPHLDYDNDVHYGESLQAAVARGIRTHTVAASGLDDAGSVVMRQIAQFTRGEFVFIEYGGNLEQSAAAHGVNEATGNNLDDILYTRIRDEIAHWGRSDPPIVAAGK